MDSSQKLIELEARIKELEEKHSALVRYVANKLNWTPEGCDDRPPGVLTSYCQDCGECHCALTGHRGAIGVPGPDHMTDEEWEQLANCSTCNTKHHPLAGCSTEYYLSLPPTIKQVNNR